MSDKIQVIMLADVKNIGRKNEILNVAPAYAKNVLIAKGYAKIADKNTIDKLNRDKAKKQAGHDSLVANIETMMQTLKSDGFTMQGKASPAGKLYAKIDTKALAESLSKTFGFDVDAGILSFAKVDHAGTYEAKLQFEQIKTSFTVTIVGTN